MNIVSIEPTPSPNTMMLHLDERLEDGIRRTYTLDNERSAPAFIRQMLHIPGVKSVFHTTDFVALDRKGMPTGPSFWGSPEPSGPTRD